MIARIQDDRRFVHLGVSERQRKHSTGTHAIARKLANLSFGFLEQESVSYGENLTAGGLDVETELHRGTTENFHSTYNTETLWMLEKSCR